METATPKKRRARLFRRAESPPPFQLTERDLQLLQHVARHRFLSSSHLAQLDGGSEQNVLRCLRILFDHNYLDRPYAQLAHVPITGPRPLVYGLGRRGAQALHNRGVHMDASDWTERNKRAGTKFIEHTLAIADFLVHLELACREHGGIKLIREREIIADAPEATRSSREPLRLVVPGLSNRLGVSSVVADGLFGLSFADDTAAYFLLEVDRGSMPVVRSRFDKTSFDRKLRVYWEAWKRSIHVEHFGVAQLRILTITNSRKRIDTMLGAIDEITEGKGSNFFLFNEVASCEGSILDTLWVSGKKQLIRLTD